jgi:centromeric protein E
MMGTPENPGVIPLCVEEIFEQISSISDRVFLIRVGYIEIYNEKVFDLLKPDRPEIAKIREESCDQQEFVATNIDEIMGHYDDGNKVRKVGETGMNEKSSRSHTIFRITIESREEGEGEGAVQVSHLNLVDLAGSERLDQTGATGDRLQEGKNINLSLHALSNVIRNLAEKSDGFVNKRDSKLTRILSNSLGGNAVTAIICTITPVSLEESHSTLNFAQNAKKIKNKPKVNEIMSEQTMMRSMQRTIDDLRKKLECEMLKNNKVRNS